MNVVDERAMERLFVAPISVCIASPPMYAATLLEEEEAYICRAVPGRRREYSAGRAAARKALVNAGANAAPIVANPDRSPRWPPGFRGSITHCEGFCSAVVAREDAAAGVGLDAELAVPLATDLYHLVCRPAEFMHFAALPSIDDVDWPKLAFSAKESFYKCYYPAMQAFLTFRDVSVAFSVDAALPSQGTFSIALENMAKPMPRQVTDFVGRWVSDGERVYTGVTLLRC